MIVDQFRALRHGNEIEALKERARFLALEARHARDFAECARLQSRANAIAHKAMELENNQRRKTK